MRENNGRENNGRNDNDMPKIVFDTRARIHGGDGSKLDDADDTANHYTR
jgi:hypothetical protein